MDVRINLMGYSFLEHTTDALIEAYGANLEETFCNATRALVDTMIDINTVEEKLEEKFEVKGTDLENLLYNWLEAVLIKVSRDGIVFSSFDPKIRQVDDGYELNSVGRGEELHLKKHKAKIEVKAVTYHMMRITIKEGWVSARFLLDI